MLLWLLCLLPVLWIALQEIKYFIKGLKVRHTKGPRSLPVLGNIELLRMNGYETLKYFFEVWHEYNHSNIRFWFGYYLNLMITEPKDVEFILSSNTLTTKSDIYDMMHPWLGDGLLNSKGSKWHKHRKMITPSFHFKILQEFHESMNINSTKFIQKLHEESKDDRIFDFQEMVKYLTLDIICDTAMGVSIKAMDNPNTEFAKAIEYMCCNIFQRTFSPLKRKLTTYQFFPEYKEYCKNLQILKDFTYDVIDKRIELMQREKLEDKNKEGDDHCSKRKMAFLDNLLSCTIDDRPLTRQEIYEEVSTFMFEGHDTTTSALSFLIFLLSRHLGVQRKVYEEQCSIMGCDEKGNATFQELTEMKYLDLVIKESQRLYPSVPFVARHTEEEYNMNGKIIPDDTSLIVFIMSLGYREDVFPDPYRFNPERFDTTNGSDVHKPFEFVPFSAGPRNCIGQKFALLEIKTTVSKIIRNFEILPALDELESHDGYEKNYFGPHREGDLQPHFYDPKMESALTLKSGNGIMIRLRKRK
ncbi:cytochrome P450 4e2-like [Haematobia irritans]|uniref:cytochrome P450 4e2-like n=1 Tax=Haematobia irritans TaxID=7368 RepID=UPI003F5065ED